MVDINNTKRLIQEMKGMSRRSQMNMLAADARALRFQVKISNFHDGLYYQIKERVKKAHFILCGSNPRKYISYSHWNTDMDGRR